MGRAAHSSSSSIDSSNHPSAVPSSSILCILPVRSNSISSSSSSSSARLDLTTDLRLGLSISHSYYDDFSPSPIRQRPLNWPPIRTILRSTLAGKQQDQEHTSLFIKIYMEGIPIGRKLNLFAQDGYDDLIKTIGRMFPTTTLCLLGADRVHSDKYHALTYEDKEGDWMMVGDVPWEIFLKNVKRMKVTRADRC